MVLINRQKKAAKSHSSDSPDPNKEVAVVPAEKLNQEVNELKTSIKKVGEHRPKFRFIFRMPCRLNDLST